MTMVWLAFGAAPVPSMPGTPLAVPPAAATPRRRLAVRALRAAGRHLGWAALALTVVGGAGAGGVAWLVRGGMLTVAAGSPRAASMRTA